MTKVVSTKPFGLSEEAVLSKPIIQVDTWPFSPYSKLTTPQRLGKPAEPIEKIQDGYRPQYQDISRMKEGLSEKRLLGVSWLLAVSIGVVTSLLAIAITGQLSVPSTARGIGMTILLADGVFALGILYFAYFPASLEYSITLLIFPQVSDTWRADELFLKVKGDMKYLYALMDDQTRFWIAQEVADTKYTADVRELFQHGKEIAEKKPMTLITDGAPNFHEAYLKEFWTANKITRTEHIQEIRMAGKVHNNKMERMNGEIRDREKVMRTLEIADSPLLTGYQLFHNYIRPHMALKGKTPAELAGIEIKGENKWITLIQNASKSKGV